jgi:hypothetical protein
MPIKLALFQFDPKLFREGIITIIPFILGWVEYIKNGKGCQGGIGPADFRRRRRKKY